MTTHNNNTNQNNNTAAQSLFGIRGQVLTYKDNPLLVPAADCYDYYPDGLVVVRDGVIDAVGAYDDIAGRYPGLDRVDTYENAVVMPGFIDCHLHYVQSPMIGSFGDTLLDWLNRYTFPTESKFRSKEFADEVARVFFRQLLQQLSLIHI